MRRCMVIIFILIIYIFVFLIFTKKEKIVSVFNEDSNNYDLYILDLSKDDINTNNIMNYFDNFIIIEIYPYINPIYDKLIDLNIYKFNTVLSNKKNISLFMNEYVNKLMINNLKEEIIKYRINGVKINKIKVYASNMSIKELLNNKKIKIIKR